MWVQTFSLLAIRKEDSIGCWCSARVGDHQLRSRLFGARIRLVNSLHLVCRRTLKSNSREFARVTLTGFGGFAVVPAHTR